MSSKSVLISLVATTERQRHCRACEVHEQYFSKRYASLELAWSHHCREQRYPMVKRHTMAKDVTRRTKERRRQCTDAASSVFAD